MNEQHYHPDSFPGLEALLAGDLPDWVTKPDMLRRILPVIIRDDRLLSHCLTAHACMQEVEDVSWFRQSLQNVMASLAIPILQEEYGIAEDDLAELSLMEEIVRAVMHCLNQYPIERKTP